MLASLARRFANLAFGGTCYLCRGAAAGVLCADCDAELPRLDDAVCPRCALPSPGGAVCGRCLVRAPAYDGTLAALSYEFPADVLVQGLKFRGELALAPLLGQMLATRLPRGTRVDYILPVPLARARLRERGFNQALELARFAMIGIARAPKLKPAGGLPRLERSVLHRTRETRSLGHASPAVRFAEVAGAFVVSDSARVRNRRVVVVDDVYTTGATFSECSDALISAGAADVHVLALARAV